MGKKKTMAYGLLLTALLLCVGLWLSVGSARARYENTDSWYFVQAVAGDGTVTSNCLVSGSQTVLLGQMELQELLVPFTLRTSEATSGTFHWTVNQPDYLQVQLLLDGQPCQADSETVLAAGETIVNLQLTPTQQALETIHEAIEVDIQVSWNSGEQMISAVFRVTLPRQTQLPTEPSEPEEVTDPTESEEESTDPTEPEEGTTGETEPEEGTTDPTEPEEGTTDPTEPEEGTTDPTEPEEDTTGETEPEEGTTGETEPETESTDPSEPQIEQVSAVQLVTLESFCQNQQLPVMVTFPEGTDRVVLTGWNADGVEEALAPFTRYSLDGGESYFLLYYGGSVEARPSSEAQIIVLLELSGVQLEAARQGLSACAYVGDTLLGTAQAEAVAEITSAVTCQREPAILTDKYSLTLQLPQQWAQCQIEYSVSVLSEDETAGILTYQAVQLVSDGLSAARDDSQELETLTLMIGKEPPQAGTYRVTVTWKFEEICFATQQTTFFINYASDAVS